MLQRSPPLVDQLIQELAAEISKGEIVGNDGRLPSESELGRRYKVSRATVREALSRLQTTGAVIRRQGIGTFVNRALREEPGLVWGWLDEAPAFVDFIGRAGFSARVRLLQVLQLPANDVATFLELEARDPVISIEKVFSADTVPVIHSRNVVPCGMITDAGRAELPPEAELVKPIYQILEKTCGAKVHHQTSEVRAVIATAPLATALATEENSPLLQVEEVGYSLNQKPLFYALHHFRGDQVSFRQIRVPTFKIGTTR